MILERQVGVLDQEGEAERFALAANQCHEPWCDEYGNHRCHAIDRARVMRDALTRIITLGGPGRVGEYDEAHEIAEDALRRIDRHAGDEIAAISTVASEAGNQTLPPSRTGSPPSIQRQPPQQPPPPKLPGRFYRRITEDGVIITERHPDYDKRP
jgi:hypothetical protein